MAASRRENADPLFHSIQTRKDSHRPAGDQSVVAESGGSSTMYVEKGSTRAIVAVVPGDPPGRSAAWGGGCRGQVDFHDEATPGAGAGPGPCRRVRR